ncbi:MAG: ankyrin repeat domain-containing protein [Pyrinomonadaceae bacterium]|nr:ankyrin repeat domain-containing protein [Pyrinomonadaceae bacterium]
MKRYFLHASLLGALFISACSHQPNTLLTVAAADGDDATVRKLIAERIDVNAQDKNGLTPLVWAARGGHAQVIAALIDGGADPNARDCAVNNWTPLVHALHKNQNEAARLLVERGADVNAAGGDGCSESQSEGGMTPLMQAAAYDNTEMVKYLLDKGANPYGTHGASNALSSVVAAALDPDRSAPNACPTETVKALLGKAPDLIIQGDLWEKAGLFFARHHGCTEMIELLERHGSVLASNQGGSRLGSHSVKVSPGCWTQESSSSDSGRHEFKCGQTQVVINQENLSVNGQTYGALKAGDMVEVNDGKVLINAKEAPVTRVVASN